MKLSGRLLFKFSLVALFATGAFASQISSCASDFSSCTVYEDGFVLSFLPNGAAVAGDVVLMDPGATTISDVFRIFNDLVDTGGGTGIGVSAFFYSSDEHNLPTTFSVNAVFITERPEINGIARTDYTGPGTGTIYHLVSGRVPEPSTFALLGIGLTAMGAVVRRRRSLDS